MEEGQSRTRKFKAQGKTYKLLGSKSTDRVMYPPFIIFVVSFFFFRHYDIYAEIRIFSTEFTNTDTHTDTNTS